MAAAICFLLKAEGFEVGARFMFVTVTTGNDSGAVIALRPYQAIMRLLWLQKASHVSFL
jgi:hypothetical protein